VGSKSNTSQLSKGTRIGVAIGFSIVAAGVLTLVLYSVITSVISHHQDSEVLKHGTETTGLATAQTVKGFHNISKYDDIDTYMTKYTFIASGKMYSVTDSRYFYTPTQAVANGKIHPTVTIKYLKANPTEALVIH
jgi:hypothetical protein